MPDNIFGPLGITLGGYLPTILAAIVVLVIGWLLAYIISRVVYSLLSRSTVDDRLAKMLRSEQGTQTSGPQVSRWVSTIVFWVIMFFTIVAFLQVLNLAAVSTPLNNALNTVVGFIPSIISAAILLFVAWLVASLVRMLITRVVGSSAISRRFTDSTNVSAHNRVTIGETIGNIAYWLVFLLFLPAILGALNLTGILAPIQTMVNEILAFLPNLFAAALILVVGYFAARIIRQIVTGLLEGVGVNRIGQRAGVPQTANTPNLASVIGTVVFVLVMIPIAIAALNALNIPAVSTPAANMLTTFLNALPALFGAVILIALAYFAARLVGNLVSSLLAGIGFDRLFEPTGLYEVAPRMQPVSIPTTGDRPASFTPSRLLGILATVAIVLFGVMAAANMLGFTIISVMVSDFLVLAGNIALGLVIFGLGMYLASLADRAIRSSAAPQANLLAIAARIAILIFSGALALRQMGLGQDIVNLAFGLLFGAVAVAVALAFGLGGRDVAARQLDRWRQTLQENPNIAGGTSPMFSRGIPATGSGSQGSQGQGGGGVQGGSSGSGHTGVTGPSDMDYEGGTNQMYREGHTPPASESGHYTEGERGSEGEIPPTGGMQGGVPYSGSEAGGMSQPSSVRRYPEDDMPGRGSSQQDSIPDTGTGDQQGSMGIRSGGHYPENDIPAPGMEQDDVDYQSGEQRSNPGIPNTGMDYGGESGGLLPDDDLEDRPRRTGRKDMLDNTDEDYEGDNI